MIRACLRLLEGLVMNSFAQVFSQKKNGRWIKSHIHVPGRSRREKKDGEWIFVRIGTPGHSKRAIFRDLLWIMLDDALYDHPSLYQAFGRSIRE